MRTLLIPVVAVAMVALGAPIAAGQQPRIEKKSVDGERYGELVQGFQGNADSARFVSGDEKLTHGDFVTLHRKAGEAVRGMFVWADPKGRLYIRTKAGERPTAVPANDIAKIDRVVPASGQADKGKVTPAIEGDTDNRPTYEIQTMTVRNGPVPVTYYFDNSLSDAERKELRALEKAAADVSEKQMQVAAHQQALDDAIGRSAAPPMYADAGPYAYYPNMPYTYSDWANYPYPWFPGRFTYVVVVPQNAPETQTLDPAKLQKNVSDAKAALETSRKNYAALASHAVYDNRGHIVAVRLEE